jgi:23S rRNA (uracil1939-C5)-methyltransferase
MKPPAKPPAPRAAEPRLVEPQLVQIDKPIYGGSFMARIEGKAVFVPLALPGEHARIRITEAKRNYSVAEAMEIVVASPARVAPACPHFGQCGGCDYQHANYDAQLAFKQTILRESLERGGVPVRREIGLLAAEPFGYRNRIRLAFDAEGNPGYRGRRSHAVIPIHECPIAAPLLMNAAQAATSIAREFAPSLRIVEIGLFCNASESALQATITASMPGRAEISLFAEYAKAIQQRIPALKGAELVAEGGKGELAKTVAQWGAASLTYRAAGFEYRVDRGAFFQVNRWLVDALVEQVTGGCGGALAWDLFAGVGLFARRLAQSFARVVAVESAPSAERPLKENLTGTGGVPVAGEALGFLERNRRGRRPDLVVVDPPRTGLGAEITTLLADIAAPELVYVSCDPATLARDLRALLGSGYAIESLTLADLFPQTFHIETVVQLRRSASA